MKFHTRCGDRVTLLHDNTTAVRNFVEFNHGLILSAEPVVDDVIFEVCIDRKVNVWNGSLEIGVTTLDPEDMELPATATKLRNTAWIMSGSSIVKDGITLINSYGPELDTLQEGDTLGVMRSSKGELLFYINSRCLGVAAQDLPNRLFAVIDLYGQCVQVSVHTSGMRAITENSLDQTEEDPNTNDDTLTSSEDAVALPEPSPKEQEEICISMPSEGACSMVAPDRLRFHPKCGILVKLSSNNKTAERARPLDDYNNGVVMTHRPLYDNELFEIRIDKLVDKWSGSIEVGVTIHNPATIKFPSTMTNIDSGTIMMSGSKVLVNGHGNCMEYGNFNLDELKEGDTVGMMRKANGKLHYFINGIDQGVATDKVEQQVWGVVDLYGMTVKVSIIDPSDDTACNINNMPSVSSVPDVPAPPSRFRPRIDEDSLLFHTLRDSYVTIISDGKTAHRPNAFEFFNNGVVMTNRTLRTNELFQVRLDLVIPKWAGSIEIGVTQHTSNDIHLPFKLSNAKSGTWVMSGEDVIRDATIIIPRYVRNLSRLVEGDTVGVMRKDMGILHFYVNGADQGPAAFNIPEHVFGIIDLYGRVAQATIVNVYSPPEYSPESPRSSESNATIYPEMCFHRVHGRNARLSRTRLTAFRAAVYSEFNDAVLFSSRPLRECDMFEIRIESVVECWIGSLEIGVTAIRPDDLEMNGIAGTATDLNYDTYILSGAAMMKNGECVRSGYPLDLDTLTIGSRVGMMWHADRSLHYYLDGMDMGKAWHVPHLNVYAVVDLYGQCTQVTILQNEERAFNYNGCNSDYSFITNLRTTATPSPPYWSFSEYCGDNVVLMHNYSLARRLTPDPMSALVFSSSHLAIGEIFEIKIVSCKYSYAGTFRMGVTDVNILNAYVNRSLPPSVARLPHYTAYIDGKYIRYSIPGTRKQDLKVFVPSFEWLRPGDRVGFKKTADNRVLVYYNSELLDTMFERVPDKVYVVMEICGPVYKIQAIARGNPAAVLPQTIPNDSCQSKAETEEISEIKLTIGSPEGSPPMVTLVSVEPRRRRSPLPYTFHYVHGRNIKLCSSDTVAMRTSGYKDGVAIVSQPLRRGHRFRFRVDKINDNWEGSMSIGSVPCLPSDGVPQCALWLEPPAWILSSDVQFNGSYFTTRRALELDEVTEQSVLTLHFRFNSELIVDIDGIVLGILGSVPRCYSHVYPLIDLYGRVSQVSVLLHPYTVVTGTSLDLPVIAENRREEDSSIEFNMENTEVDHDPPVAKRVEVRRRRKPKAYSQDNLMEPYDPVIEPGPSSLCTHIPDNEIRNKEIKNQTPSCVMHQSLILNSSDNREASLDTVQRSQSTNDFCGVSQNTVPRDTLSMLYELDFGENAIDYQRDTNIRHNFRYPEANEVDILDSEIMEAIILETGNLPDLTEEQSSSIDESTRRDDLCSEPLAIENLVYLNRILSLDQEGFEGQSLEAEWEAFGEGCEHLHHVLKYWNYLVLPFPELRQAVSWSQVKCYCSNCQPDEDHALSGWVRIERIDGVGAASRGFWHISRSTLGAAQAVNGDFGIAKRPRSLASSPSSTITLGDIWLDEESKPHHTILAIEIDIEGNEAAKDRLLAFLIYMKPHQVFVDDPLSLDE